MSSFQINKNCEGCGYCAAMYNNKEITLEYSTNGYLHAVDNQNTISTDNSIKCALNVEPDLNVVENRYIAYHKQIERRMDGSAGGVYGALLETIAKEGYFFTGTVYDNDLKVKHILTNDPEDIKKLSGHKPVQSNCSLIFPKIKELLDKGEKVLFCGTSMQCHALNLYIEQKENLILVECITTGMISQLLLDKYKQEKSKEYGCNINDIRFYNKEFAYINSKRFELDNGRTYYTYEKDDFDSLIDLGKFTKKIKSRDTFKSLEKRIGDISIGMYSNNEFSDKLGYTYISVNTEKGNLLFQKTKKRLVVVKEGKEINNNLVLKAYHSFENLDYSLLSKFNLKEINNLFHKKGLITKVKKEIKFWKWLFIHIKKITQLRPKPIYQFIKYNFFTKGIKTNYRNHGLIFIAPYSELSLAKGASIELNGPLEIGVKRVKSSKLETRLWMKPNSKIIVHKRCMFGYGSNIEIYKGGILDVGNLFSNAEMTIICGKYIKLGDTVNIAKGCTIRDTNGHMVSTPGFKQLRPIDLGNHTWICSNSTIMPGVKIGDGAIVGANSYVSKNIKSYSLVQGNPAEEKGYPNYFRI